MLESVPPRDQIRDIWRLVLSLVGLTLLMLGVAAALGHAAGIGLSGVLDDQYMVTGSRWASIVSNVGSMVWFATVAVCLFSAFILPGTDELRPWRRFLVWSALVTAMLGLDDYLAVHESADDVVTLFIGGDASRLMKDLLELLVFGAYGVAFVAYLVAFRGLIRRTQYIIIVLAFLFFAASLALDMAPHTWLTQTTRMSPDLLMAVEDGAKAIGIVLYATYFTRAAAAIIRQAARPWAGARP
jgi:hypothetical protein